MKRAATIAAPSRAPATTGPKTSHVAAAAGNERAEGPGPHPHPRYGTIRAPHRGHSACAATPARINGVPSNRVLAAVAKTVWDVAGGSTAIPQTTTRSTRNVSMPSKITAPRGTQDLIPPQSARWQELEARIHALSRRFGYGEIRTPVFESTELFVRGVGETTDIVEKEMYTFLDKGERSMTLRPEWTAPVVRAALEHNLFGQGAQRLY